MPFNLDFPPLSPNDDASPPFFHYPPPDSPRHCCNCLAIFSTEVASSASQRLPAVPPSLPPTPVGPVVDVTRQANVSYSICSYKGVHRHPQRSPTDREGSGGQIDRTPIPRVQVNVGGVSTRSKPPLGEKKRDKISGGERSTQITSATAWSPTIPGARWWLKPSLHGHPSLTLFSL